MGMFSQPLGNKYWSVSANAFINLNRSVGFINNERNASLSTMINFMPGIAFRPENLEFETATPLFLPDIKQLGEQWPQQP